MNETLHSGPRPSQAEIRRYLSGDLHGARLENMERWIKCDEFIREAVEGYREMMMAPNCPDWRPRRHKSLYQTVSGWLMMVIAGILALGFVMHHLSTPTPARRFPKGEIKPPPFIEISPERTRPLSGPHRDEARPVGYLDVNNVAPSGLESESGVMPIKPIASRRLEQSSPKYIPGYLIRRPLGNDFIRMGNFHLADYTRYIVAPVSVDLGQLHVQASRENRDSPVLSENKLSYEEMIRMGLNHLERGNWDHAASSFAEVLNLYPDEVNALFYQSMANLKQGKMEEAKRGFERVLAHPVSTFAEDAQFFRAASLKGLGRITEAEYAWREVAECGGYYAERALVELSHLEFRDSTGMESP